MIDNRPDAATPNLQEQLLYWWNSGLAWFDGHWHQIATALGTGFLIFLLLSLIRRWAVARAARTHRDYSLTDIVLRVVCKTKSLVLAIVSLRIVAGYANPPAIVMRAIELAFIVAAVLQAAIWAREIILGLIKRRAAEGNNETLSNAMGIIRLLISVALFAVAAIVILDNIGFNVTGLVAGLGIGGIAIGLAAQGIFADLFAALAIIFDRPFRNGETIKWDNSIATVERIGLKSTRLRSVNGELLIVSNTNLLDKEIANFTHLERRRVMFTLGVLYQTTPEMLRNLPALLAAEVNAAGQEFVRSSFVTFNASSLDFELLFDVNSDDYDVVVAARTEVGIRIFDAMSRAGYEFAYPTQTTFTAAPDGTMVMPYAELPKPQAGAKKPGKSG